MADEEKSFITGEEKYSSSLVDHFLPEVSQMQMIGDMEAKELGVDNDGSYPSPEYQANYFKNQKNKLQERLDDVYTAPSTDEYNEYDIGNHYREVDSWEAFKANWNIYITGQAVDKIDIYSDMGMADATPEYMPDGTVYDFTQDPLMQDAIQRGYGQKFVDDRVVNSEHAQFLLEQINRNAKYRDTAYRGGWIPMLAAGLIDPINLVGFGWASKGIHGIRALDNITLGGMIKGGYIRKTIGNKGVKLLGKGVGGGIGVAATVGLLEPLRWELDPLASPSESPAIILGAFVVGGVFHGALIPGIKTGYKGAKNMFQESFVKKYIDSQGGEEKLVRTHLENENIQYGDDGSFNSFEYRVNEDVAGIVTVNDYYTGRFLDKTNGKVVITKMGPHEKTVPEINKQNIIVEPVNENYEYLPVKIEEVDAGGTQTQVKITYDDRNISRYWDMGEIDGATYSWKDMVPAGIHKNIKDKLDFKNYVIKKEIYREIFYPIKRNETPLEHNARVEAEVIKDLIVNSTDDLSTKYGSIPILSGAAKWVNQFTDLEIGTRAFKKDVMLNNFVSRQLYSILGDKGVPTNSKSASMKNSVHDSKQVVHLRKITELVEQLGGLYNQYATGLHDIDAKFDRIPYLRMDKTKKWETTKEFSGRIIEKYLPVITGKNIKRDQKLYKHEWEDMIVKLVVSEDASMKNIKDVSIRRAVQSVRDYLKTYEVDIRTLGMIGNKESFTELKAFYDDWITTVDRILYEDRNSAKPILTREQRAAYRRERNKVLTERNFYGLDKKIDEIELMPKGDVDTATGEIKEVRHEMPYHYYPRRYLTDSIVGDVDAFTNIIYMHFLAKRLGVKTENMVVKDFESSVNFRLNKITRKEGDKFKTESMTEAAKAVTNIVDQHSNYGEIEGGMNGFIFENFMKNNTNKQSALISRGLQIATKNFVDVTSSKDPSKKVTFISTGLMSDLALYTDKISTALEIKNRHGDKNARQTILKMKLRMLEKVVNKADVTEMNKVVSAMENGVNKLYGSFSPTDPKNPIVRVGNMMKDVVVMAKLGAVSLTSQPDWANLVLVHGWDKTFDTIGLYKSLRKTLDEDELKQFMKEEAYMIPLMEHLANLSPYQRQIAYDTLLIGSSSKLGKGAVTKATNFIDKSAVKIEKALQSANTSYFQMVGLPQFTAYVKTFASMISTHRFIEDLIKAGDGVLDAKSMRRLKTYGFSKKDILIFKEIRKAGLIDERTTTFDSIQTPFKSIFNKTATAYIPNITKWNGSNIKGVQSFSLLFRQAVKGDAERTILTPSPTDNMNLAYGSLHSYSETGQALLSHPQTKNAIMAATTGIGGFLGGPVGAAAGLAVGSATKVTKGQNQVMIGNSALKLFFMFQGWTRKAMRVRGTNAVAGEETNYKVGTLSAVLIGAVMNWLKDIKGVNDQLDKGEFSEITYAAATASGAFNFNMDFMNAIDVATNYRYGGRGILGLKNPYGIQTSIDSWRNAGALPHLLNQGYDVFKWGTDKDQQEYLTKLFPYNNVPFAGDLLYYPSDHYKDGSFIGEAFQENIIKPIVE